MPAYEYYCRPYDREFVVYMTRKEHATQPIRCPQCQETNVTQQVSSFVAVTTKKS
jgi:putative FmdB family regulatory protein